MRRKCFTDGSKGERTWVLFDELKRLARPYEDEDDDVFNEICPPSPAATGTKSVCRRRGRPPAASEATTKVVNIHTTRSFRSCSSSPSASKTPPRSPTTCAKKRTVVMNLESRTRTSPAACGLSFRRRLCQRGEDQEGGRFHLYHHALQVDILGDPLTNWKTTACISDSGPGVLPYGAKARLSPVLCSQGFSVCRL